MILDKWTKVSSGAATFTARAYFGSAYYATSDLVYIVGGTNGSLALTDVWAFQPTTCALIIISF